MLYGTGACTIKRPCAQQYVGKSKSCMVISGRLIAHAPVDRESGTPTTDLARVAEALTFTVTVADLALGMGTVRVAAEALASDLHTVVLVPFAVRVALSER